MIRCIQNSDSIPDGESTAAAITQNTETELRKFLAQAGLGLGDDYLSLFMTHGVTLLSLRSLTDARMPLASSLLQEIGIKKVVYVCLSALLGRREVTSARGTCGGVGETLQSITRAAATRVCRWATAYGS